MVATFYGYSAASRKSHHPGSYLGFSILLLVASESYLGFSILLLVALESYLGFSILLLVADPGKNDSVSRLRDEALEPEIPAYLDVVALTFSSFADAEKLIFQNHRARHFTLSFDCRGDTSLIHSVGDSYDSDHVLADTLRQDRLYRAKFDTFHEYCESVHWISRQYANRLIKAGQTRSEMVPIVSKLGLPMPENEAQHRELARLPDTEQRIKVIQEVVAAGGQPSYTARQLREAVDARQATSRQAKPPAPGPVQRLHRATGILDQVENEVGKGGDIRALLAELRTMVGGLGGVFPQENRLPLPDGNPAR